MANSFELVFNLCNFFNQLEVHIVAFVGASPFVTEKGVFYNFLLLGAIGPVVLQDNFPLNFRP